MPTSSFLSSNHKVCPANVLSPELATLQCLNYSRIRLPNNEGFLQFNFLLSQIARLECTASFHDEESYRTRQEKHSYPWLDLFSDNQIYVLIWGLYEWSLVHGKKSNIANLVRRAELYITSLSSELNVVPYSPKSSYFCKVSSNKRENFIHREFKYFAEPNYSTITYLLNEWKPWLIDRALSVK